MDKRHGRVRVLNYGPGCPLPQGWRPIRSERLELFVLAYNLGNFMRRLALPECSRMKHLTIDQLTYGLVHAGRLVFAEVLVQPRKS